MSFVHLHTHSHYSLLDGLSKIDELVAHTKGLGMPAIALTDHGNLYGAIEFYQKATKAGIKPIIGVEAYITAGDMTSKISGTDDKRFHLILLVKNHTGYKNLLKLVTASNLDGYYYKPRMDKALLQKHSEGLIALSGCLSGDIPQALLAGNTKKAKELADEYVDIFGSDNFYIEIGDHPNVPNYPRVVGDLITFARAQTIPIVATQDAHYLHTEDAIAHDVLLAVQTNSHVDDPARMSMKNDDYSVRSPKDMRKLFSHIPEAIENTLRVAEKCNLTLEFGNIQLPHYPLPANKTDVQYLRELCEERLLKRYTNPTIEVTNRMHYELSVFEKTGFTPYFLMVQDFVNWAKNKGIVVGPGRGSAAGSIVAYILGITNVDPIHYNLLFERFMNPDRISPPDIDLDFADSRRDEVIDYVVQKYGRDHVAQIITFGTMAARAAIRDAGRAMGIPYSFCDRLAKLIPFGFGLEKSLEEVVELNELYKTDLQVKKLLDAAKKLEGVVRHASTHACGVVITKDSLTDVMPLQYATSGAGETSSKSLVTQYEMHAVEDLGLLKVDFLGLANLSIIEDALLRIQERHGIKLNIESIPLNDSRVFEPFQHGDTTGFFQFESAGMRRYLKELKPSEFEDLIAMVALYRPGPMELIPSYIKRKHGEEEITHLHPKLEPILRSTYGIGIYQEQMMRIARDLAGFTLAEADTLRKAIGKKIKELLAEQQEKLISGMVSGGIPKETAEAIWELFPPFARYGFNRSHAACYALIAYQTAFLKVHYPAEFMAAIMNADAKNVERMAFLVGECKNINITVSPPSINLSNRDFTIVSDTEIRFGFAAIKNLGSNTIDAIIKERTEDSVFISFDNFLNRMNVKDLNKKSLDALVKSGTFDDFEERNHILLNMDAILDYVRERGKAKEQSQSSLFAGLPEDTIAPLRLPSVEPASISERLKWEKELLGLYVSGHPLDPFQEHMPRSNSSIATVKQFRSGASVSTAGLISSIKKILTKKGDTMAFIRIEDLSDTIEAIVFPSALKKYSEHLQEENCILIKGKTNEREGDTSIICDEISIIA